MKPKRQINAWINIFLVAFVFVMVSYTVQTQIGFFVHIMGDGGVYGQMLYVVVTLLAVVVAPISSVPLIAVASGVWGWFWGAILSIIGWFFGAAIAFELSRSYGRKIILSIMSDDSIQMLRRIIPQHYTFLTLVLLRMSVPVDILSYALGLFSDVRRGKYYASTAIGIIPFAFAFAYVGIVNYRWQLVILLLAILLIWRYRKVNSE